MRRRENDDVAMRIDFLSLVRLIFRFWCMARSQKCVYTLFVYCLLIWKNYSYEVCMRRCAEERKSNEFRVRMALCSFVFISNTNDFSEGKILGKDDSILRKYRLVNYKFEKDDFLEHLIEVEIFITF
jgi:hypothetical protein